MNKMTNILDQPDEILILISLRLNFADIKSSSLANKRIYNIIWKNKNFWILKYVYDYRDDISSDAESTFKSIYIRNLIFDDWVETLQNTDVKTFRNICIDKPNWDIILSHNKDLNDKTDNSYRLFLGFSYTSLIYTDIHNIIFLYDDGIDKFLIRFDEKSNFISLKDARNIEGINVDLELNNSVIHKLQANGPGIFGSDVRINPEWCKDNGLEELQSIYRWSIDIDKTDKIQYFDNIYILDNIDYIYDPKGHYEEGQMGVDIYLVNGKDVIIHNCGHDTINNSCLFFIAMWVDDPEEDYETSDWLKSVYN